MAKSSPANTPHMKDNPEVEFVPSGSLLLDLVLGGGWATRRIANLVGDRSSGKTLLAIEACANFAQRAPVANIEYMEGESAFGYDYAKTVGMPEGVYYNSIATVEDMYRGIDHFLRRVDTSKPSLVVVDSLDSLSDDAEMERDIDKGSYSMTKAKKMSELFRRLTGQIADANCTLLIISQIRDKIGVTFGETKTRSGGRALDFYASQIVWLSEIKKLKRTVRGAERVVGVEIRARNKKNKVGPPFRESQMQILFGYGVDDEVSMMRWLKDAKIETVGGRALAKIEADLQHARELRDWTTIDAISQSLTDVVVERWIDIEAAIEPPIRKYERGES